MRKILVLIIGILLIASTSWATDYYCQGNAEITAAEWDTVPTGGGTDLTWASLADGDVLYANGKTITIENNVGSASVTVTLTTAAGSGTAGGGFTMDIGANSGKTLYTNITAGSTNCLTITDDIDATDGTVTLGSADHTVTITGGASNLADGIIDGRLDPDSVITIYGNINGGTSSNTRGFHKTAGKGQIIINGDITGGSTSNNNGLLLSSYAVVTVNGDCVAGNGNGYAAGCSNSSGGAEFNSMTITGNIKGNIYCNGVQGKYAWVPANNTKYISVWNGSTNLLYLMAGLSSDVGGTAITAANTAANVKDGTYFIKQDTGVMTAGTVTSGGGSGGAYGF